MRIAIIGAGSGVFSVKLVKDLCESKYLQHIEIVFMDINRQRLENIAQVCRRYANELGRTIGISTTLKREEALQGADFVILTALVVPNDDLMKGWDVASRLGYRFGGSLHIMHDEAYWVNFRQLQLMEEVTQDILRICPNAWLVLVSNPVLAGTTYLGRVYPSLKMVGMCHGFNGVYRIAEALHLEPSSIEYEIPGVNHFVWLNHLTSNGEDVLPLLNSWINNESAEYAQKCGFSDKLGPKMVDLYRRFGVFPIGDTGHPGGGSWGYWYHESTEKELKWKENPHDWFVQKYFPHSQKLVERVSEVAALSEISVVDAFSDTLSGEPMIPLIEGLSGSHPQQVVVNILNSGAFVEGIPLDFEVEVPAFVDSSGIHGIVTKPLPKAVQHLMMRDRVIPVELELDAYANHSRKRLIDLVLTDPWTRSIEQAESLVTNIGELKGNEPLHAWYQ